MTQHNEVEESTCDLWTRNEASRSRDTTPDRAKGGRPEDNQRPPVEAKRPPIHIEATSFESFAGVMSDYVGGECGDVVTDQMRVSQPEVWVTSQRVVGLFDADHHDCVVLDLVRSRQMDYLHALWMRRVAGCPGKKADEWLDELAYSLDAPGKQLLTCEIGNGRCRRSSFFLGVPYWAFAPGTVTIEVVLTRHDEGLLHLTPIGSQLDMVQATAAAIAHKLVTQQMCRLEGGDKVRVLMGRPSIPFWVPPQVLEGCEIVRQ